MWWWLKNWDHELAKRHSPPDFPSMNNPFLPPGPGLEEESDPGSPSQSHPDNSCSVTSAVLFVWHFSSVFVPPTTAPSDQITAAVIISLFLDSFSSELKILLFLFAIDQIIHRTELIWHTRDCRLICWKWNTYKELFMPFSLYLHNVLIFARHFWCVTIDGNYITIHRGCVCRTGIWESKTTISYFENIQLCAFSLSKAPLLEIK